MYFNDDDNLEFDPKDKFCWSLIIICILGVCYYSLKIFNII